MRVPTFPPKATPPCVLCSAASIISLSPGLVAENNMKSKQQHIFLALFLSCFLVVLFCIGIGQGSALSDNLFEANLNKKWDSTPLKTLKLSVELCQVSQSWFNYVLPYSMDFCKIGRFHEKIPKRHFPLMGFFISSFLQQRAFSRKKHSVFLFLIYLVGISRKY